jgi:dihydrofolate reductase
MKVTMVMALTVDGMIGRHSNHFSDWTGKEDKKLFKELSKEAGVVIMGSKTFDTIGHPLPGRKNIIMTRNPKRVSTWDNLIFSAKPPAEILQDLSDQGVSQAVLAGGGRINYLFAQQHLIDEIYVTFAPKLFGTGLSMFSDSVDMDLSLQRCQRLGNDMLLAVYRVL